MSEVSANLGRVTVSQSSETDPEIISITLCKAQETGSPVVFTIRVESDHLDIAGSHELFAAMVPDRIRISPKVLCQ